MTSSANDASGIPTSSPAIKAEGLSKRFGKNLVVQDLSLRVARGESFGFLGPNGAGKTTSLKMLLGLVRPTAGQAWILGHPIDSLQIRADIGFLPEHCRYHDWLTAEELLDFHGRLYDMPPTRRRDGVAQTLEFVGLAHRAGDRLRTFSKGMTQRVGLAIALLNQPKVVFLDEPTSGLDPIGRKDFRELIIQLRDTGTTVFINSHILSEVELMCDRVAILDEGKVVAQGKLPDLLAGDLLLEVRIGKGQPTGELEARLTARVEVLALQDSTILLKVADRQEIPWVARTVVEAGVDLIGLVQKRSNLEDLFVSLVESREEGRPQ